MIIDSFKYTSEPASGCWLWDGYIDRNGYARIYDRANRRIEWAHRYSYVAHVGPIPEGHEIDHMCEVTRCVNPDHLQALTKSEHARITMQRAGKDDAQRAAASLRRRGLTYREIADALDYADRGSAYSAVRAAVDKGLVDGADVPMVQRLSSDEREEIRVLYALGVPQTVIGRFYGVVPSQVSRICSHITSGRGSVEGAA